VKAEREAWEKERSGLVEKNNKKRKIVVGVFFKRKNKNNKKILTGVSLTPLPRRQLRTSTRFYPCAYHFS
jgi:hypothetical protein